MKTTSPCGDYGSYLIKQKAPCIIFIDEIRPLAGIMVLI